MSPAETLSCLYRLQLSIGAQPSSRFVSGAAFDIWGEGEAALAEAIHRFSCALDMPPVSEYDAWLESIHARQDVDFDDDLVREAAAFAPREAA